LPLAPRSHLSFGAFEECFIAQRQASIGNAKVSYRSSVFLAAGACFDPLQPVQTSASIQASERYGL